MFKRSLFAIAALAASSTLLAVGPGGPLDPQYRAPAFSDIHKGEGAMTQEEYMNYADRSWKDMGGKTIDKSDPRYSDYQKNARFELMDTNHDGSISQDEYRTFYQNAWKTNKNPSMTQQDWDSWVQNKDNPLNPTFKKN
jgi:hypothetical protein